MYIYHNFFNFTVELNFLEKTIFNRIKRYYANFIVNFKISLLVNKAKMSNKPPKNNKKFNQVTCRKMYLIE